MVCTKCGKEIGYDLEGAIFCPHCGEKIEILKHNIDDAINNESKKAIRKGEIPRFSFSVKLYESYIFFIIFVNSLTGGLIGFGIGLLGDTVMSRGNVTYRFLFAFIGVAIGFMMGMINTIVPKLLLIIAKNSELLCGKIDVDDEKIKNLTELKSKGLITEDEFYKAIMGK